MSPLDRDGMNRIRIAGKRAQQDCARWMREHGFPAAGYEMRKQHNDLLGTGDLAVEVTTTTWDGIWQKWDKQAVPDAQRRGLPWPVVWKKRNGTADPGKWGMLMTAEYLVPMALRLDKLEQASLEANDQFTQGFTAGVAYARKFPGLDFKTSAAGEAM